MPNEQTPAVKRQDTPSVLIIEDDHSFRWILAHTLKTNGFRPIEFDSPDKFFEMLPKIDFTNACILLDMQLPNMSGLDVQSMLEERAIYIPIVFISGNSQISQAIAALKNGAVDFLLKPFKDRELIAAVNKALTSRNEAPKPNVFKLTTKELIVLDYISRGWRSEKIAEALGITVRTIKMHRSNIIHKTGSNTITEAALQVKQQLQG